MDPDEITAEEAEKLIAAKAEKEANRYIHQWSEEKISVENGRYGPFIHGKENYYLKRDGKKITDSDMIQALTLDDVREMILEQNPDAFGKTKKPTKKAPAKKPTAKKSPSKKKKK